MSGLDHLALTPGAIAHAFMGREDEGSKILAEALALVNKARLDKALAVCAGFGKTEEETRAFLLSSGITDVPAAPAKRTRTAKARPEAPKDDAALLELLLAAIGDDRVGHKGLAGRFAGLDIDRVRRVLADEASRGAEARVKLEPNGRTWVRVKP